MKPIKLTIIGYLFNGVVYATKEAWNEAKAKFHKVRNQKAIKKAIDLFIKEERITAAKKALKRFGYSFSRWVELQKAKAEYFALKLSLNV